MSDDKSRAQKNADMLRYSMMSSERPLDALLPELSLQAPAIPKTTLHPRILELGPSEGDAWILALWSDPGSAQALHTQVKNLLEATLVAHLCRAPEAREALDRAPSSIQLLVFSTVAANIQTALRAFGFQHEAQGTIGGDRLQTLIQEGRTNGWQVPDQPVSVWTVRIHQPNDTDAISAIHRRVRERLEGDFWGNEPGRFSMAAASIFEQELDLKLMPDRAGLDAFESAIVPKNVINQIRWIPPILFQALCDFVGVVTAQLWKHNVEWALCEPDEGVFCPPPVFRVTRSDNKKQEHLGIAQHLMRWCVMPILPGEEIPSIYEWLESEFGTETNTTRH